MSKLTRPEQLKTLDSEGWTRYQQKLVVSGYHVPDPFTLEEWENAVNKWPNVEYPDIFNYLINTPGTFTQDTLKAYKSLEAYNLYHAGHVHTVWYNKVSDQSPVCALKSKVTPSQRITETPPQTFH